MEQHNSLEILSFLLLVFTLVTGFYMTFKGLPYGRLWSGLHKIGTLILFGCFVMYIYPSLYEFEHAVMLKTWFYLTLGLFVLSIISGSIVVNLKSNVPALLWSHRILPLLCYASGIYTWVQVMPA
jgi:hypothetical protein